MGAREEWVTGLMVEIGPEPCEESLTLGQLISRYGAEGAREKILEYIDQETGGVEP